MKQLNGRTAVITGASSGIGRALAVALADAGCRLALVDVDSEGLAESAELARAQGAFVSVHVVDVADHQQMEALPEAVLAEHGAVHMLINNAGVTVLKPFTAHSLEDMKWITDINLWGVLHGCRLFLPHMLTMDEAHIVNISSVFGIVGVPGQTLYCTTKFAVRGLSEALAEELHGRSNVRVSVVHPGGVNTGIITGARGGNADTMARAARFFARKTLSADEAAAQIITGIRKNRQRILVTSEAPMFDFLKRLMPVRGNKMAVDMMLRAMRSSRREMSGLLESKSSPPE